ncbi:MAG TPA: ribosome-associated translation inhibitor RaiA [Phycisphaerales bacterium]|jgi:putative sigma-54 modulation protein|nr:ribosome-associated translation inhibitor RaiA [Phycisphaerales bacterium]
MRIDVIGKHIEVTPAIQDYAQKKAERLTKLFDGTQQIRIYVESPQGKKGEFHVEVVVDVVKHDDFVANATGPDLYAAIDTAVDKAARQVRDFKDKLRSSPADRR